MTHTKHGRAPFVLLCLIGSATFFSSYLRIPVLPLFAATLGAGPAQVGLINGAFMVTAGILSIPAGLLVDRLGRTKPVIGGIVATAASSLLVTQCSSPLQLAAAYLLFGAGLAAFAPAMLSLVADIVPSERLGRAYGWYTTAIYVAMTIGPATGGYLAKTVGLRNVFFVSGTMLTTMALLALLALPRTAARHKTELHAALAASLTLLHNRPLRACLLATTGSCIGFGLFLTFLPLFAASHGLDPGQVGLVFAAQAITNVVGRVPIGMIADRLERRLLVSAGLFCLALALPALGQTTQLSWMVLCAVGMGIGMAFTFTAISALIVEQVPTVQRGLAMGMYNSCIYLGMMTGSTAMGIAFKWVDYPTGFVAAGVIALLTMLLFLLLISKPTSNAATTC
ncbi:MFS transporter [Trichlorobacter lovleyi]|uniref:MFS transporter n=1 Tax=Trichlorobacter lovleyi TaxID=313985 RepID=UPI002240C1BF|nr:MFS transporter [Trichlorobacter lovleyi]QOX77482.1 MFS transporter [Trichlorobacter lovleyi]